ncbi:MAG: hypothetical protein WAT66_05615 [Actinomycetota bacterium]
MIVAFPIETAESPPTSWLVDYLRRRYRVYLVALTSSRVLVLSRTGAFSQFALTWSEDRRSFSVTSPIEGRLSLRGVQLALDLEVSPAWATEVARFQAELAR